MLLLSFKGLSQKWWAFKQMGLAHQYLSNIEGLNWYKLMGTGGGDGFKPWPDWGTYALLMNWSSHSFALKALESNPKLKAFFTLASNSKTWWLEAYHAHGYWHGKQPFHLVPKTETYKMAVLTRARIKTNLLLKFWNEVGGVSKSMREMPGLLFAKGVGTLPLIEQATFSVWSTENQVVQAAYRERAHKEVIQLTRAYNWYSEELFARFQVVAEEDGPWSSSFAFPNFKV